MSHSTMIAISVSETTLTYQFGTGSIADALGVHVPGERKTLVGQDAERFIHGNTYMPHWHQALLVAELEKLVSLYDGDQTYLRQLRVEITRFD